MRQYFWSALARSNVLKRHNSTVAKSNYLARIRDTWRETRITKRIVQRGAEIRVPRAAIGIGGISSVVCVKPGFYRIAAHIAHDFSIGRTPCQPYGGSLDPGAYLSLSNHRRVLV